MLLHAAGPRIVRVIDVAPVWSGHPVGFALLNCGDRQFVAFYDADRRMTVGVRSFDSETWSFKTLPSSIGWDSHNYIEVAIDDDGFIHLAGNMHAIPLIYFRSTRPLDIDSIERVPAMLGTNESRCTYPRFLRGPANEFLFAYRDGQSGNGNDIYNVYDHKSREWRRLLDQTLTNGEGLMNAYAAGPVRGPDGFFHLCWVWRDHGGCETNHDLSYARSKDLTNWETAAGKPLPLPLTLANADVIDPVPPRGGMINGNTKLGFDSKGRTVVSYHKFDAAGNTQAYNARFEGGQWKIYQTSDWSYRWDFSGGGSIIFDIRVEGVRHAGDGKLSQGFTHVKEGSGVWTLDEATLKPIATTRPSPTHPLELDKVQSEFPGMEVRWKSAAGKAGVHYELRWETLGVNRDKARPEPWPPASMLRLYELAG